MILKYLNLYLILKSFVFYFAYLFATGKKLKASCNLFGILCIALLSNALQEIKLNITQLVILYCFKNHTNKYIIVSSLYYIKYNFLFNFKGIFFLKYSDISDVDSVECKISVQIMKF